MAEKTWITKTFNGKRYFLRTWTDDKTEANQMARDIRVEYGGSVLIKKATSMSMKNRFGKYLIWHDVKHEKGR